LWHRGDLVALVSHRPLRQHQPIAGGPDIDQMQRSPRLGATAAQRLAINRNQFARDRLPQRLRPGLETSRKLRRLDQPKDSIERVVRRDAVGQRQPGFEPILLATSPESDVGEPLRAAEHGTDGDHENVEQLMLLCRSRARLGNGGEVVFQLS